MNLPDCEKCGLATDAVELTKHASDPKHPMHHLARALSEHGPASEGEMHLCCGCALPTMIENGGLRALSPLELQGFMSIGAARATVLLLREHIRNTGGKCHDDEGDRMQSWEAVSYSKKIMLFSQAIGSIPLDALAKHMLSHDELSPQASAARDRVLGMIRQAGKLRDLAKLVRETSPIRATSIDASILDDLRGLSS